jgi:hypothetical protein
VPLLCVGDDFSRTDLDIVELTVQPGANRP